MKPSQQATICTPHTLCTVFLDRDGVINRKQPEGHYVTNISQFEVLPDVLWAIRRLNNAGLKVIVVTNQRGVALGLYSLDDLASIHAHLEQLLAAEGAHIDGFYICPHDKKQCDCRKPLTGMFEQAKRDHTEIEAASSIILGDSLSDIEFGINAGMHTGFIAGLTENRKPGWEKAAELAEFTYTSLPEAVAEILSTH